MSNGGNDLIHPKLIEQYPSMNATARNLISGIPEGGWAKDYVDFLNTQLARLPRKQRKGMINRIASTSDAAYYEAVAELVYIALWDHLRWPFEKDPTLGEQKPDFKVSLSKQQPNCFFCDVTVVRHNHPEKLVVLNSETLNDIPELPPAKQPIQQAHRLLMKIQEKFNKYRRTLNDHPFVICFFKYGHEDVIYLGDFQVRNALFGDLKLDFRTGGTWYEPNIQTTAHGKSDVGVFAFDEYESVVAVVVCREEFYQVSDSLPSGSVSQRPWKVKFGFSVYSNPLGAWAVKEDNPFSRAGFPVNGLVDNGRLEFWDPKYVEFW
jgi:hypothetical protein